MTDIIQEKLIIIGAGPAGLSAALYAARADLHPLVITGMVLYGQASLTTTIENYPGFPEGVGGTELGQLFEQQAVCFGARMAYDQVTSLILTERPFKVVTNGNTYLADSVILAMGANPRKLNIQGEAEFVGRGVSFCATCDGWFFKDKDIHVVGGGDSALEEALFLTRFAKSVAIIHRRDQLRAGAILERRARENPKISFLWDSVVKEIRGSKKVESLLVQNVKTGEQKEVSSEGVFIFIGHIPNTTLVADQLELEDNGTVRIDDLMATSIPGVFAAGEIADSHYRQVVTSAGMGAAAAIQATHYLENLE
ncbi:MAG: thioredoxin-disulfide reductase [Anaerolineaceae bacterium]